MTEITKKIASLMRQAKALDVHSLLALDYIQQQLIGEVDSMLSGAVIKSLKRANK